MTAHIVPACVTARQYLNSSRSNLSREYSNASRLSMLVEPSSRRISL